MRRLNKIIAKMILADVFLHSGWGLISPIFAIFITEQIKGGSLEIVGLVVATYWITKSSIQPFLANILDLVKGERDDFDFLIYGAYGAALVPLGYFFATEVWHIFFLEFFRGIAMACVVPAWYGIFTRHITKGWEAFSWSVQSTGLGFAAGFAAAFGAVVATFLGFNILFLIVSFFGLASATMLVMTRNKIFPKEKIIVENNQNEA